MQTRQQRRALERQIAKSGPRVEAEVFAFTDENGSEKWLLVSNLRLWAERFLDIERIPIDTHKAEDICAQGKISEDRLQNHTMNNNPRPMLICDDFRPGLSEIVDGNHTYVAWHKAFVLARESGYDVPEGSGAFGYRIQRSDWFRFVVPAHPLT